MYKITVPVTKTESITLSPEDIIKVLQMEIDSMAKPFDAIRNIKGEWKYFDFGYGSHNIGREEGPLVEPEKVEQFKTLSATIEYLKSK